MVNLSSPNLPQRIPLRAGPLTMVFEPETVFLRYVRHGSEMLLLGLYAAVRDHNWGTAPPRITRFEPDIRKDSFDLSFTVEANREEIRFTWEGRLTGTPEGTITFDFDGVAGSTFRRNRIGFCVLHPMNCAGKACVVETVGGAITDSTFPDTIAPHQPFFDLRALTHEVTPGVWAEVRMEGDTFETEDQRNWTDASYKTYCTPLAIPYPVEVAEGTRVQQRVGIRLLSRQADGGFVPLPKVTPEDEVTAGVEIGESPILFHAIANGAPLPVPRIGLGVASHGQRLTTQEIERLRVLHLAHLRTDLRLGSVEWENALGRAIGQAHALQTALELALHIPANGAETALNLLTDTLRNLPGGVTVARFLVFADGEKSVTEGIARVTRKHLKTAFPDVPLVGGTDAYFTELNRFRPPVALLDGLTYSINPQVHAFDDASLAETLATQAETVLSARTFANGLPISVSPVTLRPRFNPNATGPEPEPALGELPSQVDPRQCTRFTAGWTVGSIKYLAESGVTSITYYETTGWRGVMETETGSPLPGKFASTPGEVFPVWQVLSAVAGFAGGYVLPSVSSDPLRVEGVILEKDQRRRLLVANMTGEMHRTRIPLPPGLPRLRLVEDEERAWDLEIASSHLIYQEHKDYEISFAPNGDLVLELAPYAIAVLDTTPGSS